MTTKINAADPHALTAKLAGIVAELDEARKDVALLERLKAAEANVKRLTKEQADIFAEREAAYAARSKAKQDARFANLSKIRIVDSTPHESVLRSGFTIKYTRLAYDMYAQANVPQDVTVEGFTGLPDDVFDFLIERHPEAIPSKIRNLAGDAREAFAVYFRALRNGFLSQ